MNYIVQVEEPCRSSSSLQACATARMMPIPGVPLGSSTPTMEMVTSLGGSSWCSRTGTTGLSPRCEIRPPGSRGQGEGLSAVPVPCSPHVPDSGAIPHTLRVRRWDLTGFGIYRHQPDDR